MKAEKSRELFTVVETFTIPNYGVVELVKGNIGDVVIDINEYKINNFKGSCYRCCFCSNRVCKRPKQHIVSCFNNNIFDNDAAFYRRKTAENIQK